MLVVVNLLFVKDDSITMWFPESASFTVEDTNCIVDLLLHIQEAFHISPDHMLPFVPEKKTPLKPFRTFRDQDITHRMWLYVIISMRITMQYCSIRHGKIS